LLIDICGCRVIRQIHPYHQGNGARERVVMTDILLTKLAQGAERSVGHAYIRYGSRKCKPIQFSTTTGMLYVLRVSSFEWIVTDEQCAANVIVSSSPTGIEDTFHAVLRMNTAFLVRSGKFEIGKRFLESLDSLR
jgi:hypothetical protein